MLNGLHMLRFFIRNAKLISKMLEPIYTLSIVQGCLFPVSLSMQKHFKVLDNLLGTKTSGFILI